MLDTSCAIFCVLAPHCNITPPDPCPALPCLLAYLLVQCSAVLTYCFHQRQTRQTDFSTYRLSAFLVIDKERV